MGSCWNCQKQVTLQEDQTRCDNCKSVISYHCNSCAEGFNIEDKETKKRLRECKVCGYFICPNCTVCFYGCDKFNWQKEILKILSKEIPIGKYPGLPQRASEVAEFFEDVKISRERKTCPRGVPISYAKLKIKNLLSKVEGFRVKNEKDRKVFVERMDKATDMVIGTEITIGKIREDGNYGQEYRDVLNLLVCLGKFKVKWLKNKNDSDYQVFIRWDVGQCPKLSIESVVLSYCPKCKKIYEDKDKTSCDYCIWLKGINKGQSVKLKKRLNNCDTCQLYRGDFIIGNGKD